MTATDLTVDQTTTNLTVDQWVIEPDPDDPENPDKAIITLLVDKAIITILGDGLAAVRIRFDGRIKHYPSERGPAHDLNIPIMQDFLEELAAYMGQTVDDRLL